MSMLIDTGIFYAFYNKKDTHHLDSIGILIHAMEGKWGRVYTTNLIASETATLLRYRISLNAAVNFLNALKKSGIIIFYMDQTTYDDIIKIFKRYHDKPLSFVDAFSMKITSDLGINYLATYDERSFKGIANNIIGRGYFKVLTKEEQEKILKEHKKYM